MSSRHFFAPSTQDIDTLHALSADLVRAAAVARTVTGLDLPVTYAAIHGNHPLDFDVLTERYLTEMSHAIGDRRALDRNFLVAVERVFPSRLAEAERRIRSKRRRR